VRRIGVFMIRDNLEDLPHHELPPGYRFRLFRKGDERLWAEIEYSADEFESADAALARFNKDFGPCVDEMERRCFFVETDGGQAVGTGMAWCGRDFLGGEYGRVHWISVRPEFQGRGLGKALISRVMDRLAESHDKACLKTHTNNIAAIKLYLDFGFRPLLLTPHCREAWETVGNILRHPTVEGALRELA